MTVNHENLVIIILISLHFMETQVTLMCRISSFRREVHENCALLSYYGASGGNYLPTFQNKPKRRQRITNTRCVMTQQSAVLNYIKPLNPELNPICYLLALLGAHHFLHVSRIRVKLLTFRLLMSYIWSTHS